MPRRALPASLAWLATLTLFAFGVAMVAGGILYWQARQTARIRAETIAGGDWKRGRAAIGRYGCGGCHVIPGAAGANGKVGPDLTHVGMRAVLAGRVANTPDAMVGWLMHPQAHQPGGGMPEQGVTARDAHDMAAYLYAQD